MNGAPLPAAHGAPLRAVAPGWYATDSVKWLVRIELIEGEYDGRSRRSTTGSATIV
jgi:DMSO/TMAO reductase YedYZ molybdopterin-dependent catalytic subunit